MSSVRFAVAINVCKLCDSNYATTYHLTVYMRRLQTKNVHSEQGDVI